MSVIFVLFFIIVVVFQLMHHKPSNFITVASIIITFSSTDAIIIKLMLFSFSLQTSNDFLGIVSNLQLVNKSILLESQRMRKTSNRYLSIELHKMSPYTCILIFAGQILKIQIFTVIYTEINHQLTKQDVGTRWLLRSSCKIMQ